jgi:multidrug efflux pump subunit AcrA (membrane-fusion protein)
MNKPTRFKKFIHAVKKHKIISSIAIILLVLIGYSLLRSNSANAAPTYTLSAVRMGNLKQTVSGTGQVSASNQTDILSQVSGTILSINAKVGQSVRKGDLIATIDPTNARISLENARLSLEKLVQPAKVTELSNATTSLAKSYSDTYNSTASAYTDMTGIISGMKDLFYGQNGFLGYSTASLDGTARDYISDAGRTYDAAVALYDAGLSSLSQVSRSSPENSLDDVYSETYATLKKIGEAIGKTQNAIAFITENYPNYHPSDGQTAVSNANSWASKVLSDLSGILSGQNAIQTGKNSLTNLVNGADELDVKTARLNVEQAQRTYSNYFIRAPYDGVIGRIPVNVYGQAGNSTAMATIIGNQKIANISLNEVDAAKVKAGQPVQITFDAIDGLNATGTVEQIDQVGTVSQGVVSYAVKILINTDDERIKPGMSVNTSIISSEQDGVLLVPTSAIKTQNGSKMVQVFDRSSIQDQLPSFATSTNGSNKTRQFSASLTVSTKTQPRLVRVQVGESDETNTIILSGLERGQLVVTKTTLAGSGQSSAPTLFSSLGSRNAGPGSTIRVNNR